VTFSLDTRKFEYVDQPVRGDGKGMEQSKTAKNKYAIDAKGSPVAE
jgi:hypothetical protein